ncbi:methyl-accepting chemotaxis protein [Allopseudospirillum japonicum]|uniref:Methyl-accepting chemotaxis protein n=1 Tax=Allopseudospirillum japonicum TaxID=64971 RepID=A0A1H6T369_9GAMM|nr:methyl-accepting chemotaxis protein [Allopseudospirillum japonicum]SEI72564.1 methyl-accepting chemotaxis protein [Allopseudospirillum japonicum]
MTLLNQVSVRVRLWILGGVPLLGLILMVIFAGHDMRLIHSNITTVYEDRVLPLGQLKQVSDQYAINIVDNLQKFRGGLVNAQELTANFETAVRVSRQAWAQYVGTYLTAEEKQIIQVFEGYRARAREQGNQLPEKLKVSGYRARAREQVGALMQDLQVLKTMPNQEFNQRLYQAMDPMTAELEKLIQVQLKEAAIARGQADINLNSALQHYYILAAVLAGMLILIGSLTYRSILYPLKTLQMGIETIEETANLTLRVQVQGQDEIAATSFAFNSMMEHFQKVIRRLHEATQQVAASAEQMAAISRQVSHTAQEQETQTTQVATAVSQTTVAIEEVARYAVQAADTAQAAERDANEGEHKVQDNIRSMQDLFSAVEQATQVIDHLHTETDQIAVVLETIQGIAEQTNLLALNAAIEAARAGESGRGFAVVADEVRQLAASTHKATGSIKDMIEGLQTGAQKAVHAMAKSRELAQSSAEYARLSGQALESINQAVDAIVSVNTQISAATEEQTSAANEINTSVSYLNDSIREISEGASQTATASEELARLAHGLQQQVDRFTA